MKERFTVQLQILIVVLSFSFSANTFGQITIGPRFGVNISNQGLDSPYEIPKVGTVFGGALNVPIKNEFSVHTEFVFSQKGYREEFNGTETFDELTATYIEIPVMARYTYPFSQINVFGEIGPYLAYWSSGKYESRIEGGETVVENYTFVEQFDSDGYRDNRLDYGMTFGAGVLYDRIGAAGNIVLDLRYAMGINPANETNVVDPSFRERKNSTFSISLMYMFYF